MSQPLESLVTACIGYTAGLRDRQLACCLRSIPVDAITMDHGGGVWNRSRALNNGIRQAKTPYVATTDCDILFSTRFWRAVEVALVKDHYLLLSEAWGIVSKGLYPRPRGREGQGGFCLFPKSVWEDLGGYDEQYQFWGAEDNDWVFRVEAYTQKKFSWLEDLPSSSPLEPRIYHQWHPKVTWDPLSDEERMYEQNRIRLAMTRDGKLPLVRNR